MQEILDQLGDSHYFSTFDLAQGYYQVGLKKDDRWKTALATPGYGHYQFCKLPMGLKLSSSLFERFVKGVLKGLQHTEMFLYLDDVVVP